MLPKSSRIVADQDFARVYKQCRRLSVRNLRLVFLRTYQKVSRFGYVLSKKSVPKSTGRNRVKRILRAATRQFSGHFPSSYDIIIQGLSGCKTADAKILRDELRELFTKAKLMT